MRHTVLPLSPLYSRCIYDSLLQQIVCAVLCLLLLDGGRIARVCGVSVIAYWAAAAALMAYRPTPPDPQGLAVLRWGFLPLLAFAITAAELAR